MKLKRGKSNVLCIPDLQCPFEHKDAFDFVSTVASFYDIDEVVCIGDEIDQHAIAPKFFHDPDGRSAGDELRLAIKHLEKWYDRFPEVKVCTSNHTGRIFKKAFQAGIPKAYLRRVNDFLEAPAGWVWKDHWVIDGVKYEHGDNQGGIYAAQTLALANRMSTVIGHHHSHAGVSYMANDTDTIFGLNVGCLIDRHSYVFEYGKGAKYKPTLGCGVILEGIPYFIPMILDNKERWTGEVI